jgi:hypothetical protein
VKAPKPLALQPPVSYSLISPPTTSTQHV